MEIKGTFFNHFTAYINPKYIHFFILDEGYEEVTKVTTIKYEKNYIKIFGISFRIRDKKIVTTEPNLHVEPTILRIITSTEKTELTIHFQKVEEATKVAIRLHKAMLNES